MAVLIDPASGNAASDEIMHYGILGMKWGVRRQDKKGSSASRGSRKERLQKEANAKKDVRTRTKVAKAHARSLNDNRFNMSNEELDAQISRLQKQKQLRELTESEVTPGKRLAKDAMKGIAKTALTVAVSAAVTVALDRTLSSSSNGLVSDFSEKVTRGIENRASMGGGKKNKD